LTTDKKMVYRISGELAERVAKLVDYCRQAEPAL
jgi:hypothetical protein